LDLTKRKNMFQEVN